MLLSVMVAFRALQRCTRQVPQYELAVFTDARKALCATVTAPSIEGKARKKGRMAFAARYYALLEGRPHTCKIILPAGLRCDTVSNAL
jgi:hypothetical protein